MPVNTSFETLTSFSQLNLDPLIHKAIDACGYTTPTPIQASSIPVTLTRKDLIATAQTGTGKTAAFVLPALQSLCDTESALHPRVLILTPTRELAEQITQAADKYGKFLRFKIVSLVGGMSYQQQIRNLSRPVDIVVATPGRLLDHMQNRRINLSQIQMLILDEADRMLDMGFIDDVKTIAKATPGTRQTLLFSATSDDKLAHIINQLLKNPVRIDLSNERIAPIHITQKLYVVDNPQHKTQLFDHLLENESIFKAIIFSATRISADRLAKQLGKQGYAVSALHGGLKQNLRNRTIAQLHHGKIQFLVATDVAARGIDVNDVSHVINYDLPKFSEDYVHRIGRTGRGGKSGIAISFALPADARHVQRIERFVGQSFEYSTVTGLEPKQRLRIDAAGAKTSSGNPKKRFNNNFKNKNFSQRSGSGSGRSEGRSSDSRRMDGGRSEGRSSDSRRMDGGRSEGRNSDSRRMDGGRSEGRNSDSRRMEGGRNEGQRTDSRRMEGGRNEGRSNYARRTDGGRSEGRSNYARRTEGGRTEGRHNDTRRTDGGRSEGRSDARRTNSGRSEGRSNATASTHRKGPSKRQFHREDTTKDS